MADPRAPVALRVRFDPRGGGAVVRWEAEVLGARTSRLVAPLPPEDLALVLRALDVLQDPAYPHAWNAEQGRHFSFGAAERARLAALALWAPDGRVRPDAPRRVGRRLYNALTMDPAGAQALGTVRDHAAALGLPLALELCFPPGATDLAALPWELLWDDGPAPMLFARGAVAGLSRRLDLPQPLPPPRAASGPLRILAVSPRAGISAELRQVERAARLEAWRPLLDDGRAEIREVEPADRAGVLRAAEDGGPPDIVHYYGHGRVRAGEGALLLDGGDAWTPAAAIAATFGGAALVVLHACQGATLPAEAGAGEPLLGGVAQALCAAGVPAVLGMQLTVRVSAATRAAGAIYAALAAGRSLQDAVAGARRALFVEERDGASWFVPALYLRDRADGPFFLRPPAAPAPAPAAAGVGRALGDPAGAMQAVLARGGGRIRALRVQGRAGSSQSVVAESGGRISDVTIISS